MKTIRLIAILSLFSSLLLTPTFANAAGSGFHYQLDLTTRLVTNVDGKLTALSMSWLYDKSLSSTLMDGEDLSESKREETLKSRAADIQDGLKGVDYFTTLKADGKALEFNDVTEFQLDMIDDRLQLNIILPIAQAIPVKSQLLEIIISDSSAVGLATFIDETHLTLEEPFLNDCKAPTLSRAEVDEIDGHIVVSETMTLDCR